jgi:ATP-dependent exoDNAse (exonuclease V) beta subunit
MKASRQGNTTVTLNEQNHTYTDQNGKAYKPATKFVESFFPRFDSDANALRVAIKEGTSKDAILARWKATAQASCEAGTRTHVLAESILTKQPLQQPASESERKRFSCVWNACQMLDRVGWKPFFCEWLIFSPRHGIAGTVDLIMIEDASKTVSEGKIWILDWKTNKAIDRNNKYGQFALEPIKHVPDCNFAKYTFQLRLYERIINEENLMCGSSGNADTDCAIIWIPPESETPEFIPVPRIDTELDAILSARKGSQI